MSRRCIAGLLAGAAVGAEGARISRKSSLESSGSKELAGVPVLNYNLAYGGRAVQKDEKEHWVVVAKRDVSTAKLEEMCKSAKVCEMVGHPSEGGVPFFEVYSTEQELEQVLALAPEQMEFAEPDGTFEEDPDESDEPAQSRSWGVGRVGVPNRFADGAGASIYVFDTGIRVTHNDFSGRASHGFDCTTGNLRECDGSPGCGQDVRGHGTHCAGSAAGDEFGVASKAKLYSGKVLSDSGSGSFSWSYAGLDWVASSRAKPAVVSMSLGGRGTSSAMRSAVERAVAAGVVVSVASGNSNSDACNFSPAFVMKAITVGSTDSRDARSSFSNYGRCVQIWAPGSSIVSADVSGDNRVSTKSGTSMACPHVSGAAALVLGQDPSKSPAQVLDFLVERSEKDAITGLRQGDVNYFLNVAS